jgi:hypothetical protein
VNTKKQALSEAEERRRRKAVLSHFKKLTGYKDLEVGDDVECYYDTPRGDPKAPDYVLYAVHTYYMSLQNKWLNERMDEKFPHRKHMRRMDADYKAGFRMTVDIEGIGPVTVDIFDEAYHHQGCF